MSKKNLLKEELNRHRQLLEYTFYMPEDENDENDNLLFDNSVNLYEQDPIPGAYTPVDTDAEVDPFAGLSRAFCRLGRSSLQCPLVGRRFCRAGRVPRGSFPV